MKNRKTSLGILVILVMAMTSLFSASSVQAAPGCFTESASAGSAACSNPRLLDRWAAQGQISPDLCKNIAGWQLAVPTGMTQNANGDCVAAQAQYLFTIQAGQAPGQAIVSGPFPSDFYEITLTTSGNERYDQYNCTFPTFAWLFDANPSMCLVHNSDGSVTLTRPELAGKTITTVQLSQYVNVNIDSQTIWTNYNVAPVTLN